ncbi:MAG: MFS transporter [Alphaproteobacteria bacterium]|nr:MFS transporter [Alphaproteobacteria bacterium]MCW5743297.1 MFS transporter [Alphaproteobacteria bacterium]
MAVPALVIALAQMGDSLIYAVLPLYADAFGVSLFVVGILLSLNRWVRLLANSIVAHFTQRIGVRPMMIAAATTATISTLAYALATDEAVLMAARMLWGISFAALNLAVLAYAVSDRAHAGRRVAVNRTTLGAFQVISLAGGAALVAFIGPRDVFLVIAGFGLAAMLLSLRLPALDIDDGRAAGFTLPRPGRLDLWGFALGLIIDGIFIVTLALLMKDTALPVAPVVATGLLLATRWGMEVLAAPIGGVLADRCGTRPLAIGGGLALIGGLVLIALGHELAGSALVVTTRGLFNTLVPVMVAERARTGLLASQATYSTWRDLGAAVGPVVAGAVFAAVPQGPLYGACAALMALGLWWCVGRTA